MSGLRCIEVIYETIQEQLKLPVCNEQFGSPLIPFFMPMWVDTDNGPWYLGEDYAFCERARQCGFKIHVDTRIRLWHVGSYKYSWEDAGGQLNRFGSYCYRTGVNWSGPKSLTHQRTHFAAGQPDPWSQFQSASPWPERRPSVVPNRRHGWLSESSRALLNRHVSDKTQLVVELGAWLGLSSRHILDRSQAVRVVSVDHWEGSDEHRANPGCARLLPRLFETYLTNNWDYRDRLIPLRMSTQEGLRRIAEYGLQPDLIYIDADHRYEAVVADLELSLKLFPAATIVGDDWDWEEVRKAVETVALRRNLGMAPHGTSWEICRYL